MEKYQLSNEIFGTIKGFEGETEGSNLKISIKLEQTTNTTKDYETLKDIPAGAYIFSASGRTSHSGGQNLDYIKEIVESNGVKYENGWSKEKILRIIKLWEKYHLNDTQAGTKLQEDIVNKIEIQQDEEEEDFYDKSKQILKEKNLLVDRGYSYSTGWLFKPIPKKIVEEMKKLIEGNWTKKETKKIHTLHK